MPQTRIPTQKRSVEKKNKIIKYGFRLMCTKGYHNTTTTDIAKKAGVSTGIIYQYFNDKKEIFVAGINIYSEHIMFPIINIFKNRSFTIADLTDLFNKIINEYIKNRSLTKDAHEQITAMAHLDHDIALILKKQELKNALVIVSLLQENQIHFTNMTEKVYLIMKLISDFSQEIVFYKHEGLNYDKMREELLRTISYTLK